MLKKASILLVWALLAAGWYRWDASPAPVAVAPPMPTPDSSRFGFPLGEELHYKVYWGMIPVGNSVITTGWTTNDGRALLKIRYRTKSNSVIATLYPVDDTIECLIDPDTFLPVLFMKDNNEGHYWTREKTTFDHQKRKAVWRSFTKQWETCDRKEEYKIDADTRDVVSFMYALRKEKFKPGETRNYRVMADDKIYDLIVKTSGPEKAKAGRFGKVSCIRVEPDAKFNGLFVRKGKATVWVSDDERRLCPRVEASVPIASINVILDEVKGPGNDFWIQKSKEQD